jgi:hypothetical protein
MGGDHHRAGVEHPVGRGRRRDQVIAVGRRSAYRDAGRNLDPDVNPAVREVGADLQAPLAKGLGHDGGGCGEQAGAVHGAPEVGSEDGPSLPRTEAIYKGEFTDQSRPRRPCA